MDFFQSLDVFFLFFFLGGGVTKRHFSIYTSARAQDIETCLLSVIRLSMPQSLLYLMHEFLSNFSCCTPWAFSLDVFLFLIKKPHIFQFLALLDCFSRAQEIEIRPSVCGINYL